MTIPSVALHVTTIQKLAYAEALIRDLCEHEGAEGFSDSTHVAIDEFNRMIGDGDRGMVPISDDLHHVFVDGLGPVTLDIDDERLNRATRAEDALRDLVDDLHKRATACTALMATAATVEDQTRLLNKHIVYEHCAGLAHLALLSLRDPQS